MTGQLKRQELLERQAENRKPGKPGYGRRAMAVAVGHVLRTVKSGELSRASALTQVSAGAVAPGAKPLPGDFPSFKGPSGTGSQEIGDSNLPPVLGEVLRSSGLKRVTASGKVGKVDALFGRTSTEDAKDLWKGVSFLERVSLAAAAAAGVNKKEAVQSRMHAYARAGDAASMKAQSAHHRTNWIMRSGSRLDAQMSFVGRALPPADRSAVVSALRQHKADFTSSFETPAHLLLACKTFVEKWAKTKLVKPKVILEAPCWPSGSSCFERSAKKGGTMSYVLERAEQQEAPTYYLSDAVAVEVAMDISQFSYAIKAWKESVRPCHRVTCITERGLKTRVVNVGPAWCQVLGHSVRKHLLRGLKATQGAFQPLTGANDDEILKIFDGCTAETLVSTDLTRATDLLPLDLVEAVVAGLEASGRLSAMEIDILKTLTGPQDLMYPELDGSTVTSTRGILMGLPTSWCILSLIHLFWMDVSKTAALKGLKATPRIRFSICGDDALLATTVTGAAAYQAVVKACGGEPSKGKHYECTSGYVRRGVFLERLHQWRVENGRLTAGVRFAAIPVKGLTSRNLPRDFTEDRLVSCRSFGLRQILTMDALLLQNPILKEPLMDYMTRRVPWLPAYARDEIGLIGGFPLSLGGFAFAPRPTDITPAIEVRDSGRSFSLAVQRELDPKWRMAVSFQEGGRELAIAEGDLVDLPLTWTEESDPTPPGWVVVEDDARFFRTVMPIYRQVLSFDSTPNRRTVHLRASDFRRSLLKIRAEGRANPSGLDIDTPFGPRLIRWRLSNRETPERGLSWHDATEFNRSAYETEVFMILLENFGLLDSYKGAFRRPSEALLDP